MEDFIMKPMQVEYLEEAIRGHDVMALLSTHLLLGPK